MENDQAVGHQGTNNRPWRYQQAKRRNHKPQTNNNVKNITIRQHRKTQYKQPDRLQRHNFCYNRQNFYPSRLGPQGIQPPQYPPKECFNNYNQLNYGSSASQSPDRAIPPQMLRMASHGQAGGNFANMSNNLDFGYEFQVQQDYDDNYNVSQQYYLHTANLSHQCHASTQGPEIGHGNPQKHFDRIFARQNDQERIPCKHIGNAEGFHINQSEKVQPGHQHGLLQSQPPSNMRGPPDPQQNSQTCEQIQKPVHPENHLITDEIQNELKQSLVEVVQQQLKQYGQLRYDEVVNCMTQKALAKRTLQEQKQALSNKEQQTSNQTPKFEQIQAGQNLENQHVANRSGTSGCQRSSDQYQLVQVASSTANYRNPKYQSRYKVLNKDQQQHYLLKSEDGLHGRPARGGHCMSIAKWKHQQQQYNDLINNVEDEDDCSYYIDSTGIYQTLQPQNNKTIAGVTPCIPDVHTENCSVQIGGQTPIEAESPSSNSSHQSQNLEYDQTFILSMNIAQLLGLQSERRDRGVPPPSQFPTKEHPFPGLEPAVVRLLPTEILYLLEFDVPIFSPDPLFEQNDFFNFYWRDNPMQHYSDIPKSFTNESLQQKFKFEYSMSRYQRTR